MIVSSHIRKLISAKLDVARVVVWYDGEQAFGDFIQSFSVPGCRVVSAQGSRLRARREAEQIYRQMNASESLSVSRANLLIYLPFKRSTGDAQLQDPFEVFAAAGDIFGDEDSERLESLACQALPDMVDQIEQVFEEGKPTLAMLDQLERKVTYPLVRQALGTQSIIDVTAQLLGDPDTIRKMNGVPGCGRQTLDLLGDELGFAPAAGAKHWKEHRAMLARYVLFSELAFDLPGDLPPALANIPHADEPYREPIYAIAERLRDTASYRECYVDLAMQIERELELPVHFARITVLGQRDTFAFEERQHLVAFTEAIEKDQREAAHEIILVRTKSVWRHEPERAQIWKVAERCMAFLNVADRIGQQWTTEARSVGEMVAAYAREGGWSELDRHQRLMEQSIAECTACEQLENVITRCRARYREVIDVIQKRFLKAVEETAWPRRACCVIPRSLTGSSRPL